MKIFRVLFFVILVIFVSCGTSDTKSEGQPEKGKTAQVEKKGKSSKNIKVSNDPEAFVEAARLNDTALVEKFLAAGADVNSKNKSGVYPLHWAAWNGNMEMVKKLVEKHAYIDVMDGYRDETPLSWAAKKGHLEVVKYLVEKGAAVNNSDRYKETPLMDAARYGHDEMVRFLLYNNAKINDVTVDGVSALMFASMNGHENVVKTLLEFRADINKIHFKTSKTARGYAEERKFKSIVELIARQAKVEGDLIKRPAKPADTQFVTTPPDLETLRAAWAGREDYLPSTLEAKHVTSHMNKFLPDITQCYQSRYEQGDRNMMGTMELMVRVAGSGVVLDAYFTTEKYQSSLFGDCILDAIKSRPFPQFYDGQIDFKYTYTI